MNLRAKACIVTGAASGIGKAIAARFAREGGKVGVADLQIEAAHRTVAEIEAAGGTAIGIVMEVTSEAQVREGVARIVAMWGGVDVSGQQRRHPDRASDRKLSLAEWKRMLAIHLDGAFLTTQACIPHVQRAGRGGSIVYIGSVHSKEASVLKSAYVTAKHGLIGFAKTVAKEGARYGIRANVVCPGFVRTPLVETQIPEQARALSKSESDIVKKVVLKETVDGEFTTVDDVAGVTLMFASFPSSALTGQSMVVSHGWFMQ
jgi:3-hydroxybutyrate dehydrogenase